MLTPGLGTPALTNNQPDYGMSHKYQNTDLSYNKILTRRNIHTITIEGCCKLNRVVNEIENNIENTVEPVSTFTLQHPRSTEFKIHRPSDTQYCTQSSKLTIP